MTETGTSQTTFLSFPLYLTFLVVHLIYTIIEWLHWSYVRLKTFVHRSKQCLVPSNDSIFVERFVANLERIPTHLCVILQERVAEVEDIANIIVWSMFAGITCITLYDHSGELSEYKAKYLKHLKRHKIHCDQIHFEKQHEANGVMYKNGFRKKIHVRVENGQDGKELYMEAVRELSSKSVNFNKVNSDVISDELRQRSCFDDPELALICGPIQCTYGYSPWSIRFTEFVTLNNLRGITIREYCNILKGFAYTDRRFGK